MSAFKGFPELIVAEGQEDGLYRVETTRGVVVIAGKFRSRDDAQRLVDCWNAVRHIAFPLAHIPATEEYVTRLETLRKEAVSRAGAAEVAA